MGNEVATKDQASTQIRLWLSAPMLRDQLQKCLPDNMTVDRLERQVLTLCHNQYGLNECTPLSVLGGVVQAAELNLELSNVLGHCYLVPRWNSKLKKKEAVFQVGYRGFLQLMARSGHVGPVEFRTVFDKDDFKIRYGTDPYIHHVPAAMDRGDLIGYYVVVNYRDRSKDFEYMSVEECRKHRDKYSPLPADESRRKFAAWATNEEAMSLKTVCRRIAKRSPMSVQAQLAAVVDEYEEAGIPRQTHPALEGLTGPIEVSRTDQLALALSEPSEGLTEDEIQREEELVRTGANGTSFSGSGAAG